MVTIKDIASYTGVSPTTISNVIHGRSGRVSAETVEKVNEAIRLLGYTPNMSARSLVSHSSRLVAFINHVITREHANMLEDPFHSTAIGMIEWKLREQGYFLMLRTVKTTDELQDFLRNWNVDGIFLTGAFNDAFFEALSSSDVPTVLIDSYVSGSRICNVGLEDRRGSYLATRHLIDNGHTRIGFATPPLTGGGVLQERYLGYLQALEEASLPKDESFLFQYEMDNLPSCFAAAEAIARQQDNAGLTAVTVAADQLAAGILSGLEAKGKHVPSDISLVGFDDLPQASLCIPPLTTVRQDMGAKAEKAVEYMLQLLAGDVPAQTDTILPVELVERRSVRNLRKR